MKQGIHPDYHKITVVMTDGSKFETYSTYGKEGDSLQLDVDSKTHPAWTGAGSTVNQKASQVAKFNKKFSGLGLGAPKGAAPAPTAAKPEEKKEEKKADKPAAKKADKKA